MFASLEKQNLVRELRRKVGSVRRKFITSNASNISGRIERSYEIFDYEQYIISPRNVMLAGTVYRYYIATNGFTYTGR